MTKKSTLLLFLFFLVFSHVSSQSNSVAIVKEYYPLIYTSIKLEAEKQWANDKMVLDAVMEGQAKAFIEIAENQSEIDATAMADALLFGSLENQTEYNRSIIDELSIANPYPLLRCNWYKVNEQYKKTKKNISSQNIVVERNIDKTKPVKDSKYKDEIYDTDKGQKTKKAEKDKTTTSTERKKHNYGAGLGIGLSNITGLDDWSNNANPGKIIEARFLGMQQYGEKFWGRFEISVEFIQHSIKDNYSNKKGNLNQSYINTYLIYGFNKNLSTSTTLLIGLGGFFATNLSTNNSKYYDNESELHPNSNDLDIFNYGLSGLLAIQWKRYEFALHPNWGFAEMSRDDYDFKTRTLSFSVSYLFEVY